MNINIQNLHCEYYLASYYSFIFYFDGLKNILVFAGIVKLSRYSLCAAMTATPIAHVWYMYVLLRHDSSSLARIIWSLNDLVDKTTTLTHLEVTDRLYKRMFALGDGRFRPDQTLVHGWRTGLNRESSELHRQDQEFIVRWQVLSFMGWTWTRFSRLKRCEPIAVLSETWWVH